MGLMTRIGAWLTQRDLAADQIGYTYRGDRLAATQRVTPDTALRHSAVFACTRLRANLVSMMPVDVYRQFAGVPAQVSTPLVLQQPEPDLDFGEWLWASQYDLDRFGNSFGIITATDAAGRPAQIELVSAGNVTVRTKGRRITEYRVDSESVDPRFIWHERQYRPAGSPLGLSPIGYAAWSIGGFLSAQQFALDWYSSGAAPSGVLRNTEQRQVKDVAARAKAQFKEAVRDRDIFVTGKDWEWTPAQGDANSTAFLEEMRFGLADVCRFFDVPGDMIDAPSAGKGSVTYANITQRNLQLLTLNLDPALTRRERTFTNQLVTGPRYVRFNRNKLLAMDPQTRAAVLTGQVAGRILTPDEARAIEDRPPFTEADYEQFDRLFGSTAPAPMPLPAAPIPSPDQSGTGQDAQRWQVPRVEVVAVGSWPGAQREPLAIEGGWAPPDERSAAWR